jgi:hypothetical protein
MSGSTHVDVAALAGSSVITADELMSFLSKPAMTTMIRLRGDTLATLESLRL